jgi:MSHA biogenesis protein MshG
MFRNVLIQVILSLESGFSLSQSLVQHKHIFSGITLALIEVGENTGELENSFYQIKKMMESDGENAKRIKTALRYPLFVLIAIMFAIGVVNVLVIPSFKSFFMSFDAQLPLPTRILIACSDVLVEHGFILLLLMASSLMFALWYARLPAGKLGLSWFFIHIPYVGTLVKRCIYARFCRAFSMTLKANVPLVQAFTVVAHVAHNPFIAQKINTMRQYVEHGDSFYLAAQKSELFGDLELQMLMVGEETGKLDAILLEMANFYENDLDYDLKNLSTAIEPVLIIVVSGFVLVLALGVFLPMWDISAVALRNVNGG